jgi:isohexenylglutaconyl-CoA hydratase
MQAIPTFETVLLEQQGAVLYLILNRPAARNAMSLAMLSDLQQALQWAESTAGQPEAVRVVVVRGAGGHFCAGADLKDMAHARMQTMQNAAVDDNGLNPIGRVNAAFGQMCAAFAQTPLALVMVLEGTVMGGGFGLACVADVALADASAVFKLPETSLGIVPAQIAPFLVERLGYSQAKRLAVTGGRLDAHAALQVGLVHAVAEGEALQAELSNVLTDILGCAPQALAATKALMDKARFARPKDMVLQAAQVFAQAAQSAEGLEGMTAFMQKRKPQWAAP